MKSVVTLTLNPTIIATRLDPQSTRKGRDPGTVDQDRHDDHDRGEGQLDQHRAVFS